MIRSAGVTGYLFTTVDFLPVRYFIIKLVLLRTAEMIYKLATAIEQVDGKHPAACRSCHGGIEHTLAFVRCLEYGYLAGAAALIHSHDQVLYPFQFEGIGQVTDLIVVLLATHHQGHNQQKDYLQYSVFHTG
jgi:hypothetical protein